MTVWDDLVGQRPVIEALSRAAAGDGMTHAAVHRPARVGSLQRRRGLRGRAPVRDRHGCGTCKSCHTVLTGSHADVKVIRTEKLSIGVDEVRDLVRSSALAPSGDRWQIMIVEDSDRLTDQPGQRAAQGDRGADGPHRVAALRADDRGRPADHPLPLPAGLADDPHRRGGGGLPGASARGGRGARRPRRPGQGHIGRARALARDEETRRRRREVVSLPARLTSLGSCMTAATNVVEVSKVEAEVQTADLDAREKADLDTAYGVEARGRRPREYAPALNAPEKGQKTRAKVGSSTWSTGR